MAKICARNRQIKVTQTGIPRLAKAATLAFFVFYFLYFAILNSYHLVYLEQIQLFRFDWGYFTDFLIKPGGLSEYFSAFIIQFYISPIIGAFMVTLSGIVVFILSHHLLKKQNIRGFLWPFIPVTLLVALQSDHMYNQAYTIGFILCLIYVIAYSSVRNNYLRYTTGLAGWILLYMATGSFAFLVTILCIIHETWLTKNTYRYLAILGHVLLAVIFPYIAWRLIYYMPLHESWLTIPFQKFRGATQYSLLLLLAYFPLLMVLKKYIFPIINNKWFSPGWNWKTVLAGILIIATLAGWVKKYAYDYNSELLLAIDNCVQQNEWEKALKFSSHYPEINPVTLYFTNLSLYKTGKLGDKLFHYQQIGIPGLWPDWETNKISPFFGCDIFYHLGYMNEAYRWAFETLVAEGQSPRLLKQLVMASLINSDYAVARKYLNILNQTLFYRQWTRHYLNCIKYPELLLQDKEIASKRKLLIHDDFFAGSENSNISLTKLLENHPENKMAYEYYMASLLLKKDITNFADNIRHIKNFGYRMIPVHFEEALLWYMGHSKKNVVPEGYLIRELTIERFKSYKNAYSSYSGDPKLKAKTLFRPYGNTYWFYYHFINNRQKINEKNQLTN